MCITLKSFVWARDSFLLSNPISGSYPPCDTWCVSFYCQLAFVLILSIFGVLIRHKRASVYGFCLSIFGFNETEKWLSSNFWGIKNKSFSEQFDWQRIHKCFMSFLFYYTYIMHFITLSLMLNVSLEFSTLYSILNSTSANLFFKYVSTS